MENPATQKILLHQGLPLLPIEYDKRLNAWKRSFKNPNVYRDALVARDIGSDTELEMSGGGRQPLLSANPKRSYAMKPIPLMASRADVRTHELASERCLSLEALGSMQSTRFVSNVDCPFCLLLVFALRGCWVGGWVLVKSQRHDPFPQLCPRREHPVKAGEIREGGRTCFLIQGAAQVC